MKILKVYEIIPLLVFSFLIYLTILQGCQQKNDSQNSQNKNSSNKTLVMKKVQGTILQDSHPLKDATVMIVSGTQSFHDIASLTDDKGQFSFNLMPGHYKLKAFFQDKIKEQEFDVPDKESTLPLVVKLD